MITWQRSVRFGLTAVDADYRAADVAGAAAEENIVGGKNHRISSCQVNLQNPALASVMDGI